MPVALLEPADLPSQGKQDIKVRQGRNLRSQGVTDSPCRFPADMGAAPAATSAAGVSGRRAAVRHTTLQGVDPVPVAVAPRLVDAPETRAGMGHEQHPQRAYALPVVVDGHASSAQGVMPYGLGCMPRCIIYKIHDAFRGIRLKGTVIIRAAYQARDPDCSPGGFGIFCKQACYEVV